MYGMDAAAAAAPTIPLIPAQAAKKKPVGLTPHFRPPFSPYWLVIIIVFSLPPSS